MNKYREDYNFYEINPKLIQRRELLRKSYEDYLPERRNSLIADFSDRIEYARVKKEERKQ